MLSRLSLTFFLLFFSNKVLGAQGEGGMPQLNPASFSSQIFWLFISFSILFLIVHFFLLPRLKKIREHRDETINNYLSETQNLNHQIDNIIAQTDKELNEAKTSFNDKIKEELENNKIIFEKEVDLIEKDFEKFWSWIGAEGDFKAAKHELTIRHNKNKKGAYSFLMYNAFI